MFLLKNKNIYFSILLLGIFLLLCLPNSIKQSISIIFFEYSFLVSSLIYLPFIIKSIVSLKNSKAVTFSMFFIFLSLLTCFVSDDYILQRFIIGVVFFIPFFVISDINWDYEKLKILQYVTLFIFLFLSIQVVLSSLGLIKFNNVETKEIGNYNRVGTTAGVASYTAPVLVLLFVILNSLFTKKIIKSILLLVLCISVFLSGTRSSLLIILFALLLNLIFVIKLKYKVLLIFGTILIAPIVNNKFKVLETIEARNQNAKDYSKGDITSGRVERWLYVKNKIEDAPETLLTGVGGANTPYFNRFKKTKLQASASPHNVYLGVLYEHGIILLLIFLCFLFTIIKKSMQTINISSLMFLFTILITFNTEVFPLGVDFSSLFFMSYCMLSHNREFKLILERK